MSSSSPAGAGSSLDDLLALANGGVLNPSPTLGKRLIVLSCFLGSLPVLSAALFGLHVVATRRRGDQLFLWRKVQREEGRYIVGSRVNLLCLMALFVFGTLGGGVYSGYRFFQDLAYGTLSFQVCTFAFWSCYYIFAWSFTSANFATWALVSPEGRWKPSPLLANCLFLIPLAVGEAVLLSICIFGAVETQRFFSDQDPLLDALGARGGTLDVGKLLPLIEKYFSSSAAYYKLMQKIQIVFVASLVPLLFLNLAAVAVWATLRRHRKDAARLSLSGGGGGFGRGTNETHLGSPLKAMRGVERMFLVDALAITAWSISIMVHTAWTASVFPNITTAKWHTIESAFFVQSWLGTVPLVLALLAQIVIAWQHLPPASQTDAETQQPAQSFVIPSSSEQCVEGISIKNLTGKALQGNVEMTEVGRDPRKVELGEEGL